MRDAYGTILTKGEVKFFQQRQGFLDELESNVDIKISVDSSYLSIRASHGDDSVSIVFEPNRNTLLDMKADIESLLADIEAR